MLKGLDLTGVKQQVGLILAFVVGYAAGELDGLWFLLGLLVVGGGFAYRRHQVKARERAAQIV